MNQEELDNSKVEFSQDEFYWFSRRRHWKVYEYFRLIFNNKNLGFPAPGTPEQRYLRLIAFEIKKGEHLKLINITPSAPDDKFIRPIPVPLEIPIRERPFYTDILSAWQAFSFAFHHHYVKVWQNSPQEYRTSEVFSRLMNSDYAVVVSPEFLGMQEEIFGKELKDFAKTSPVWTGWDIIQIVFGPRYKDEKNLKLDPVASFIRLAEGHIQTGNLSPLKSSPSRDFLKAIFKPAELVRFIYREDVFQWLKRQGVDILEWVSEMFDRIEIEAEEAEAPPEDSPEEKQKPDKGEVETLAVSLWEKSDRKMTQREIYDHSDMQKILSNGRSWRGDYVKKHIIGSAIKKKREVGADVEENKKPKKPLTITRVGEKLKAGTGRKSD